MAGFPQKTFVNTEPSNKKENHQKNLSNTFLTEKCGKTLLQTKHKEGGVDTAKERRTHTLLQVRGGKAVDRPA